MADEPMDTSDLDEGQELEQDGDQEGFVVPEQGQDEAAPKPQVLDGVIGPSNTQVVMGTYVPPGYEVWHDGVFKRKPTFWNDADDDDKATHASRFKNCPSKRRRLLEPLTGRPMWIETVGTLENTKTPIVLLRYLRKPAFDPKHSTWDKVWVEWAMAFNKGELVKMVKRRLPVNSENAGSLVKYLQSCLDANHHMFVEKSVLTRPAAYAITEKHKDGTVSKGFGWLLGRHWYGVKGGETIEIDEDSGNVFVDALRPSGDPHDMDCNDSVAWYDFVAPLWNDQWGVRWLLSVSFASVLVRPLKERAFIVHHFAKTKSAKTAVAKLGESIWGDPELLTLQFASTMNSLMDTFRHISDFPVVFDELQAAPAEAPLDLLVYLVGGQKTKQRLDRTGAVATPSVQFSGILRTTGEEPMVGRGKTDFGGQATRVIELPYTGIPEHVGRAIHHFLAEEHYGWAGRTFLGRLTQVVNDPEELEMLKERKREFVQLIRDGVAQRDKIEAQKTGLPSNRKDVRIHYLDYVALIALAEHLAMCWVFNWPRDAAKEQAVQDGVEAIMQIRLEGESRTPLWEQVIEFIREQRVARKEQWGEIFADDTLSENLLAEKTIKSGDGHDIVIPLRRSQPLVGIATPKEYWLFASEFDPLLKKRFDVRSTRAIWQALADAGILDTEDNRLKAWRRHKGVFSGRVYVLKRTLPNPDRPKVNVEEEEVVDNEAPDDQPA